MDYHQRILHFLAARNCDFEIIHHEKVVTTDDVARVVPELAARVVKTIVFRTRDNRCVLAALDHQKRVDYKMLASAIGLNRRDIRTCSPDEVRQLLGAEVGGVGPFPVGANSLIVADSSVSRMGRLVCGGGRQSLSIEIDAPDFLRLCAPIVAAISK